VNNAGTAYGGLFLDVPLAKHVLTYQVNTVGLMAMTHAFLPDLIARPEGHLVNIASASGFVGLPYGGTYASSKWAVIGLSESLRLELEEMGHRHVHVVTVCPSYVRTELFAGVTIPRTTRVLEPEELASKIVEGVRKNKVYVLAPAVVHITPVLKGILPRAIFDWSCRWFGINTSMRPWRGRPVMTGEPASQHRDEPRVPVGDRH
jgi:short-subunit dehydrogenase